MPPRLNWQFPPTFRFIAKAIAARFGSKFVEIKIADCLIVIGVLSEIIVTNPRNM